MKLKRLSQEGYKSVPEEQQIGKSSQSAFTFCEFPIYSFINQEKMIIFVHNNIIYT